MYMWYVILFKKLSRLLTIGHARALASKNKNEHRDWEKNSTKSDLIAAGLLASLGDPIAIL
jgi:hypothetical protein